MQIFMKFSYQSQCFRQARDALMLPFFDGEDGSLAHAFHLCSRAIETLDARRYLLEQEEQVLQWIRTVEKAIDTTDIEDPDGIGTWRAKARRLSKEDQSEFASAVRELAAWFAEQS